MKRKGKKKEKKRGSVLGEGGRWRGVAGVYFSQNM
jgi:hypothetical protein